jgi:nicotinate-nucleotide--dimethylbenzimidazole phosphoribosyltransferase
MGSKNKVSSTSGWLRPEVASIDASLESSFRARIDAKAKPPGSLGRIEDLAVQLGMIWHPQVPRAGRAALLIFAADHGLTNEGVSRYPSSVTAAMVTTFLAGRASANAFASACNVDVHVVDAGVAADLESHPGLIAAKIARGTANAAVEPAMSRQAAIDAITRGHDIAVGVIRDGADILALGEMGIGNTASSALITHRLAPAPLDDCIGQGAGQDEAGMARKRAALQRAAARVSTTEPLEVLSEFGGFEIAMMVGAVVGAAAERRPVVIDGFIASAAALVAIRLCPDVSGYCVFAHRSAEYGHQALLRSVDAGPLLDLGLRLGEGTGAILAVPLIRAAARLLTDVADLAELLPGAS